MVNKLSITPITEQRIFQCPNCRETINTSASQCPFCSAAIDPGAAQAAADFMSKVNQACSDASYLRIVAGMIIVFLGWSLIPLVGIVGTFGYWFLLFAVPAMAVRWWVKFGAIKSDDPDFHRAKRATKIAVGIWAIFLILTLVYLIK